MAVRSAVGRLALAHADGTLSKSEYLKERRVLLQQWLSADGASEGSGSGRAGLVSEQRGDGLLTSADNAVSSGSSGNRLMESLANAEDKSAEEVRRRAAEQILRAARESGADNLQHPDDTVFLSRGSLPPETSKPTQHKARPRYQWWLWVVAIFSVVASGAIVAGVWGAKGSWLPDLLRSVFSALT